MSAHCPHGSFDASAIGPFFSKTVEGRRGQILDAALAVFAEKGYEGGTMRDIASRVGVTEPALYRHYAGKEALFTDLVAEAGARITARAGARIREIEPAKIQVALSEILAIRCGSGGDDGVRPVIAVLLMAAPHNGVLLVAFRDHILQPMFRQMLEIVPAVDAHFGVHRTPEELKGRVGALIGLFIGSFMTSKVFGESAGESDAAVVDAMLAMMGWDTPAG
jgi:AcrR family transcriptional regulator